MLTLFYELVIANYIPGRKDFSRTRSSCRTSEISVTEMSSDAILAFLENSTPESQLVFHVGSLCAPVLKNLKVANLISTEHGDFRLIRNDLKKSRILCYVLYTDSDRDVLLLFRRNRMENAGATIVGGEGLIANNAPDDDAIAACKALGAQLAG